MHFSPGDAGTKARVQNLAAASSPMQSRISERRPAAEART